MCEALWKLDFWRACSVFRNLSVLFPCTVLLFYIFTYAIFETSEQVGSLEYLQQGFCQPACV